MNLTAQQGLDLLAIAGIMHALVAGAVCTALGCFKDSYKNRVTN